MSTPIKMNVHFAPGKFGRQTLRKGRIPKHSKSTRLPRITRLMALSFKYEELIHKGLVETHGELAELAGADRSQISFIVRLRLLAPDIQEWFLNQPETEKAKDPVSWRQARSLAGIVSWDEQRRELRKLLEGEWP